MEGVGAVLTQRLYGNFGSLGKAWEASPGELREVEGVGPKLLGVIQERRSQLNPEKLLKDCQDRGFQFWIPPDPDYPHLLLEIPSLPPVLYYRGQVDLAENQGKTPLIGIVGTRNITEYGQRWARQLSTTLAKHGFTVISGLASGVDAIAHQSCLAAGGRTIAVLGTGIDIIYPRSNTHLYQQIPKQGLILSDYPPGTPPEAKNFPPRNRIIAGLSRVVLVIEAARRSGALITARYANEFGRDVYVLPGSLDQPQSSGCLELANKGAQLILGEKELIEALGEIPQLDQMTPPPPPPPDLPPHIAPIFAVLSLEPLPVDVIAQKVNLDISTVSVALFDLELMGLATALPGMLYQRRL